MIRKLMAVLSLALPLPCVAADKAIAFLDQVYSAAASANATSLQGRAFATNAPTDGQVATWSTNCSCWLPATVTGGGGGGGSTTSGWVTIGTVVVDAAGAAQIEFVGIPQTFAEVAVDGVLRGDTEATGAALYWHANGNTSSVYQSRLLLADGGGAQAYEYLAQTRARIGDMAAQAAPTGFWGQVTITWVDYTNTIRYHRAISQSGRSRGTGGGDTAATMYWTDWLATGPITSLHFTVNAGGFTNGTELTLRGYRP